MFKRVFAMTGIVILLLMYVIALISSFFNGQLAFKIFQASIVCTVIVPVLIYGFLMFHKMALKYKNKK